MISNTNKQWHSAKEEPSLHKYMYDKPQRAFQYSSIYLYTIITLFIISMLLRLATMGSTFTGSEENNVTILHHLATIPFIIMLFLLGSYLNNFNMKPTQIMVYIWGGLLLTIELLYIVFFSVLDHDLISPIFAIYSMFSFVVVIIELVVAIMILDSVKKKRDYVGGMQLFAILIIVFVAVHLLSQMLIQVLSRNAGYDSLDSYLIVDGIIRTLLMIGIYGSVIYIFVKAGRYKRNQAVQEVDKFDIKSDKFRIDVRK